MSAQRPSAVVADDEPLLRAELREQLALHWPQLQVVAEAADGAAAVAVVEQFAPDVAFLDVRMPRMDGLEAALRVKGRCLVVFVTAYDHYALQAFDARAADYLVKPLDTRRLQETIARLKLRLAGEPVDVAAQIERLSAEVRAALRPVAARRLEWLKVSSGATVRLVDVADVFVFRAVTGYTQVTTADAEHLIRMPLRELLDQLDPTLFVQVHRSAIVNLRAIAAARRLADGRYAIELRGGRGTLETSRARAEFFREG